MKRQTIKFWLIWLLSWLTFLLLFKACLELVDKLNENQEYWEETIVNTKIQDVCEDEENEMFF